MEENVTASASSLTNAMKRNNHPLNQAFKWQQPTPPYGIISQEQAQLYRTQGGFVFENAFSADELAPLIADLDAQERAANEQLRASSDTGPGISRADEIVFAPHLVQRSKRANTFSRHSVFTQLARDLIGPQVRLYWDQLVYKRPGTAQEFPWHQDNGYTFVEPQQYLTCWVALTDATVENGCPWIAPDFHQGGTLKHIWTDIGFQCLDEVDNAIPLELKAGSIAVFSSLTPHRTGPNLTDDIRRAYILQYAPDGARIHGRDGSVVLANDEGRQYVVA